MTPSIDIYADTAYLTEITAWATEPTIRGFTVNPTLLRAAGVTNLRVWAHEVLVLVPENLPVSIPMLAPDVAHMEIQARAIADWGRNVYVKIPIQTSAGESTLGLVRALTQEGIHVNITAVFKLDHVVAIQDAVGLSAPYLVSMFAGRIADAGRDPVPDLAAAAHWLAATPNARLVWASARQVGDVVRAAVAGCHIITLPPALLLKLSTLGKDLDTYSRETVAQFEEAARELRW